MSKQYYTLTLEINNDHVPPWMQHTLTNAIVLAIKELQVKCAVLSPAGLTVQVTSGEYDALGRWQETQLDFNVETKEGDDENG